MASVQVQPGAGAGELTDMRRLMIRAVRRLPECCQRDAAFASASADGYHLALENDLVAPGRDPEHEAWAAGVTVPRAARRSVQLQNWRAPM